MAFVKIDFGLRFLNIQRFQRPQVGEITSLEPLHSDLQ
jgi:hypothetical protein